MKKIRFIIYSVSLVFIFSSCVKPKDELLAANENNNTDTSLSSIQVSESFDWSTSRKINFSFTGSSENDYQLIMKVMSPDGTVLFQKLQQANEDYKGIIELPAHYENVNVSFGSTTKSFDCKDGSINMTID